MSAAQLAVELARSGEGLKSGPLGLAVVLVLCVASYFLFKSMSKHLKKVREEFPADPTQQRPVVPPASAASQPPAVAAPESPGGDGSTPQS
jgi:hypothetical protein